MPENWVPTHTFTVFTPTFNRAHTLPRVYNSLRSQTFTDFEWLVVDDGSTDETRQLVGAWAREAPFPIRYFHQPNSGKHVADNFALREARGRFYATLDSDDWYLPNSLDRFLGVWNSIDAGRRNAFVGVVGLCADPSGAVIGSTFPDHVLDTTYTDLRWKHGVTGDNAGCARTDVVRRFPHPLIAGENLIIEALVLARIAREYQVRCVNEILRVTEYQLGGISDSGRRFVENPRTTTRFFLEQLQNGHLHGKERLRAQANHARYALHARLLKGSLSDSPSKILWLVTLPVAVSLYLRDRAFSASRRSEQK
jgi:glycosyltransferase involved in cell wall biosynthesis